MIGGIGNRAKSRQRPDGIGKFGADAANAAVGEARREQPIAPVDARSRTSLIAQADQKLQSVHDIGFEFSKKCPVLHKLALPHQREHGDRRVFPVLAAAFRDDLPARRLLGPFGAQALIRGLVIAEIPRRLKKKIAIDDPQTAILRRTNLKDKPIILHLACLLNVARARSKKFPVLARVAPVRGSKWLPIPPELASFVQEHFGIVQMFGQGFG